jgi:RNA polymerase sigma-70 factor (ECF subfamily)
MIASLRVLRREHRPPADVSDERLVALCASGNAAALDLLFRRHGDRVFRFLARLPAIDRRDLEDLVKKTFLEAYRAAASHTAGTAVSVWIIGTAVKVTRRYERARGTRPMLVEPAASGSASRRSGESARSRLASEIAKLPEDLQLVFVLCDLEEIRGADIARILGLSQAALWLQVHEVRARLQKALDPPLAQEAV